jgi:hypothetical protein
MVLTVGLLVFGGVAAAQEMMIQTDSVGCQVIAPFAWMDLEPGKTWRATVDLSQCTESDFGWYDFYGFIMKPGGATSLSTRDGIVLKVQCERTGAVSVCPGSSRDSQDVYVQVDAPGRYVLTAENTGRKMQRIRLSWLKLSYR